MGTWGRTGRPSRASTEERRQSGRGPRAPSLRGSARVRLPHRDKALTGAHERQERRRSEGAGPRSSGEGRRPHAHSRRTDTRWGLRAIRACCAASWELRKKVHVGRDSEKPR